MKRGLMKIGYFGEESSHTYACASENFPKAELIGFSSMAAAAEAVEKGSVSGAVVPIENSVGGSVGDCLDALKKYNVYITAQFLRPIVHSLIGIEGAAKSDVRKIYSHPQAIAQCDGYIKKYFPDALVIAVASTSEALKIIKNKDEAALARKPEKGQTVLENDVQDAKDNTTRFVLLQKQPLFQGNKVSVLFETRHRPGALLKVLGVLADFNLNMTKLESRPSRDGIFEYWFYVEFSCDEGKETLMRVMQKLSEGTGLIKFVGYYR